MGGSSKIESGSLYRRGQTKSVTLAAGTLIHTVFPSFNEYILEINPGPNQRNWVLDSLYSPHDPTRYANERGGTMSPAACQLVFQPAADPKSNYSTAS